MVILATELTIAWNKIQGVNDAKSVGQLIPLMIGVGGIGHVLLVMIREAIRGPKPVDEKTREHLPEARYNLMVLRARRRTTPVIEMTEAEGDTSARTSETTSISSQEQ
jgi:hypothetical protein